MASPSISKVLTEIPSCDICFKPLSYPIRLECGHIFDADCLGTWARFNNTCPMDRTPIDVRKISYDSDIIKQASATFRLKSSVRRVDPIVLNVHSNVQKLKELFSNVFMTQVSDPVTAIFSPRQYANSPRSWCLFLDRQVVDGVEIQARKLFSDTRLSEYQIEAGRTYEMTVQCKLPNYGLPCDRCYRIPEQEKICSHPDEVEEKSNESEGKGP